MTTGMGSVDLAGRRIRAFEYHKGDRWATAVWLECVRCGHGIAPGSKVVALSASLRYGPQIVHADPLDCEPR